MRVASGIARLARERMSKESTMPAPFRIALVAAMGAALAGCQVLASLSEERMLWALVIFVAAAALAGFLFAKMRR
jgi:hypothetical protein